MIAERSWPGGRRSEVGSRELLQGLRPYHPITLSPYHLITHQLIPLTKRRVSERKFHLESGADSRSRVSGQGPAVGGNNAARQVQPDPESRGPRSTREAIEQTREELRWNTRPLIGNGHHRPT